MDHNWKKQNYLFIRYSYARFPWGEWVELCCASCFHYFLMWSMEWSVKIIWTANKKYCSTLNVPAASEWVQGRYWVKVVTSFCLKDLCSILSLTYTDDPIPDHRDESAAEPNEHSPQGWINMSATEPTATPPARVAFWIWPCNYR